jgi:hypothetical protein
MRHWLLAGAAAAMLAMPACNTTVKVEPIEVQPIHITMDINIKIDREVDDFFNEVKEKAVETNTEAQTAPSSGDQK